MLLPHLLENQFGADLSPMKLSANTASATSRIYNFRHFPRQILHLQLNRVAQPLKCIISSVVTLVREIGGSCYSSGQAVEIVAHIARNDYRKYRIFDEFDFVSQETVCYVYESPMTIGIGIPIRIPSWQRFTKVGQCPLRCYFHCPSLRWEPTSECGCVDWRTTSISRSDW